MRTFRDSWSGLFTCQMPVLLPTDSISQLLIQCLMHIEHNVHCVCLQQCVAHTSSCKGARVCLRLAGTRVSSDLRWSCAFNDASAESKLRCILCQSLSQIRPLSYSKPGALP